MDGVDNFIENAINWRNYRRREMTQERENQANELGGYKENLSVLADEIKKSRDTIEKNLASIMSYKHNIHKIQESESERGLPITNTYHGQFVNFISNSMAFVNEIDEPIDTEIHIDESKLSANVQMCNENVMKLIHKGSNAVDEMQTTMESIHTVKEYSAPIAEEELSLSNSSFFDGM